MCQTDVFSCKVSVHNFMHCLFLASNNLLQALYHALSVPQIRFQRSEYSVLESDGSVEVCVELVGGPLEDNVIVHVSSQSATAAGTYMYYQYSICNL